MRLLLRVVAVMMGLMTLLIGGGMAVARAGVEIPPSAWVAYTVAGTPGGLDGIYLVRVGGGPVRKINANDLGAYSLQWDRDGLLFVSSLRPQGDVYRLSVDGQRLHNLTDSVFDESQIALSPDGKRIAFGLYDGIQAYLAVMSTGGGDAVRLVHTRDYLNEPAWSPDATWIAFVNHTGGEARIYIARADGSDQQLILSTESDGVLSHLGWSADGEWIYFSGRITGHEDDIVRIRREGGEVQPVVEDGTNWQFEHLSPDGQWMTAIRNSPAGNGSQLYLMRIDATDARLLFPNSLPTSGVYEQQSAWSPDGQWIAYAGCGALQCGIYLISFDGRTHRNLAAPSRFVTPQYPAWSPPVHTRLRWWVVIGVGAALVAAGIAYKPHP